MSEYEAISNRRAIEIYKWVCDREVSLFIAAEIPGWSPSMLNKRALAALVQRGLVVMKDTRPRVYKLGRMAPVESCLEIPESADARAGISRYHIRDQTRPLIH